MSTLLPLAEAQQRLLTLTPEMPIVEMSVEQASGYFLAEAVRALRTQPAAALSAMDGWALRQSDLPGPWRIIGESAAGAPFDGAMSRGSVVRISTGAMMPPGADMVLVQEDCRREGDTLHLAGDPPSPLGRHIRAKGMDFTEGDAVLAAGLRVSPARLALAISAGRATLPVRQAPKIAIIDTGNELRAAGAALEDGAIPASNGPMLAAMAAAHPCAIDRLGPVADDETALAEVFAAARDADILITTGGASVGDHDLVRPALEAAGARIDFWRVAIKPGKPIMIGRRERQLVIGLPGNPVSSFVTAQLFVLPVLRAALGSAHPLPMHEMLPLASALPATGKRTEFLRARYDQGMALPLAVQDSGALSPLARAELLIVRPAGSDTVAAGEKVPCIVLKSPFRD